MCSSGSWVEKLAASERTDVLSQMLLGPKWGLTLELQIWKWTGHCGPGKRLFQYRDNNPTRVGSREKLDIQGNNVTTEQMKRVRISNSWEVFQWSQRNKAVARGRHGVKREFSFSLNRTYQYYNMYANRNNLFKKEEHYLNEGLKWEG